MPISAKCTLTELMAYYQSSDSNGIQQKYPGQYHFLLVPSKDSHLQPLTWTPSSPHQTARLPQIKIETNPEDFSIPKTVVIPIAKSSRNQSTGILVGRDNGCDIRFSSDQISSIHAIITINNVELWVKDYKSTNGTYINQNNLDSNRFYKLISGNELIFADIHTMYVDLDLLTKIVKMQLESVR